MSFLKFLYWPTIAKKSINKRLKKLLEKVKENTVLDLGFMDGKYKKQITYNQYIAMNIKYYPNVNFIGNVYNIPLKDNSIDFVLMIEVSYCLDNIQKALKEIHRVLKPKKTAIVSFIFMYPYLKHEQDTMRYTYKKLEELLRNFKYKIYPAGGILSLFANSFIIWTKKFPKIIQIFFIPFIAFFNIICLLDIPDISFATSYIAKLQKPD